MERLHRRRRYIYSAGLFADHGLGLNGAGLAVNRAGVFYASAIAFDFNVLPANQGGVGIWKSIDGGLSWAGPVYSRPRRTHSPGVLASATSLSSQSITAGSSMTATFYVTWTAFGQMTGRIPIVFSRSTEPDVVDSDQS
jgi:hypothetical protein